MVRNLFASREDLWNARVKIDKMCALAFFRLQLVVSSGVLFSGGGGKKLRQFSQIAKTTTG